MTRTSVLQRGPLSGIFNEYCEYYCPIYAFFAPPSPSRRSGTADYSPLPVETLKQRSQILDMRGRQEAYRAALSLEQHLHWSKGVAGWPPFRTSYVSLPQKEGERSCSPPSYGSKPRAIHPPTGLRNRKSHLLLSWRVGHSQEMCESRNNISYRCGPLFRSAMLLRSWSVVFLRRWPSVCVNAHSMKQQAHSCGSRIADVQKMD